MTEPQSIPITMEFLFRERSAIVDAAEEALRRGRVRHYETAGSEEVRLRLERLYDGVVRALQDRDLGHLLAYARGVADERYTAGYDLGEIQTAFNALEEAIWSRVFGELRPEAYADALSSVSAILGAAKDALARQYVSLATQTRTPPLDVAALFAGTERA